MANRRQLRDFAIGLSAFCTLILFSSFGFGNTLNPGLDKKLAKSAPNLNPKVLQSALQATRCAISDGIEAPERLAVIDFSLPSSEQRLWIFDLTRGKLVMRELVAHGKNSGAKHSTAFSNIHESYQSSIGLFKASESYYGRHGYSLRLDGLEHGINDHARERAIVIHGADYVAPSWVREYGRIGRSHGCPAVRQGVIRKVVDTLKGGQLVFKYYPEQNWLRSSRFLNCGQSQLATTASAPDGTRL